MNRIITRRNVLRGLGVCLALPWLESLAPRAARAGGPEIPKRLLFTVFPNGAPTHWWENAPAFGQTHLGDAFKLPTLLSPFEAVKSKMMMISHLGNHSWSKSTPPEQSEPSHARAMGALTTCVDADAIADGLHVSVFEAVLNGISFDQMIVQKTNPTTPIPSLQLGLEAKSGTYDHRSYAMSQCVSWKSQTEALKRVTNPKAVFDKLIATGVTFGTPGANDEQAKAEALRRAALEKSVLDPVLADANSLMKRVSTSDRQIVERYMDEMRKIETQVTQIGSTLGPGSLGCTAMAEPAAVPEPQREQEGINNGDNGYDHEQHANIMNDLIVMAVQCDLTHIITYMLADARSEFNHNQISIEDRARIGLEYREGSSFQHHGEQHGISDKDALTNDIENGRYRVARDSNLGYAAIVTWFGRKTAELAQRLDAIPEGDGTVLDHTVMTFMSEMRTHDHDCFDLPLLMLGGKGVFKQNAHVAYQPLGQDRQLRDLWYTVMNEYFDAGVTSFGDDLSGAPNRLLSEILL